MFLVQIQSNESSGNVSYLRDNMVHYKSGNGE